MGSSPTGGVVSSPGLHNFFSCFTVLSRGCPSAKNEPLGHNSSSAASSVQATLRFRLPAASYFPFLLSTPAVDTEGIRPCGQSPMDFESISLAARTQCLLPARTHHATWHTESFLLVSHLSSHCGSHWFTVLSHLQLVSSMAKKQASQSPKNIPKHKLVGPSARNSSVCKCAHIYREHKGNK